MASVSINGPILDHIVIVVSYQDLENLSKQLEGALCIVDGGGSLTGPTINKLLVFPDGAYIEFVAFNPRFPEKRDIHRWGKLPEGSIVDWAYTLRDQHDLGPIQQKIGLLEDQELSYSDLVFGGRVKPDGAKLEWSVALLVKTQDKSAVTGKAPFWCLDKTPRDLRVPYRTHDGTAIAKCAQHGSGVSGVAVLEVSVPPHDLVHLLDLYKAIHGDLLLGADGNSWSFKVHTQLGAGACEIRLIRSQDEQSHIGLTLRGDKSSPSNVTLVPGLTVGIIC